MELSFLIQTPLFQGVQESELKAMLPCLGARERFYQKDEIIYHAGQTASDAGMVLCGSVNIVVNFYWGGSHIFGHVEPGQLFAETYAAISEQPMLCDAVAAEDCEILFLNLEKLMTTCRNGCAFHNRIIKNLIHISARNNLNLSARMMHTASKSIRERLVSYFSEQARESGGNRFTIPFSRQQLAEYLGVDRSALSNELSKMQRDGLIRYHKNDFSLLSDFDITTY